MPAPLVVSLTAVTVRVSPSASEACANTPEAAVALTVAPATSVAVALLATGARSSVIVRLAVAVPPLPSLTV